MTPPNAELREALLAHHRQYKYSPQDLYLDKLEALFQAREQKLLIEARLSERAWAYKNMRDHGTDPQWVEIAKLRMERLQNKTNDGGS